MRLRILLPILALLVASLTARAQQPAPAAVGTMVIPDPNQLVGPITAPDADIDTVIGLLKMLTNRDVVRTTTLPAANQTFNIELKQMPRQEALALIITVMKLNGIGVVELGDRALLVAALNQIAREAPEIIEGTTLDRPASGKIATKIFKLNFISSQQFFSGIAASILSQGFTPSQIQSANAAIVTDTIANLQRVEKLIEQFDQPNANISTKGYTLTAGTAQTVLNTLNQAIAPLRGVNGQLGAYTTLTADARTNQIIVVASPDIFPFFDSMIAKLDIRADPNTVSEVIVLKHATAADVQAMLNGLITGQNAAITRAQSARPTGGAAGGPGGQQAGGLVGPGGIAQPVQPGAPGAGPIAPPLPAGAPANQPLVVNNIATNANLPVGADALTANAVFSQGVAIAPDARINAIIVSGTASDVALIKKILAAVDVVLPQVRIEVVAVEVSLGDNDTSGISALGLSISGDKLVGFSGSGPTLTINNGTVTRPGTNSLASYDLAADIAIATTPRTSKSRIYSVPSVTTTHNRQASFFSGETRPVITGTTTATTGQVSSSVTQQQIGTSLTVLPLIGIDGTVEMTVTQDLTDVSDIVVVDGNNQYVISQKRTESTVSAKSGEIVIVGRFIKQTNSKSTSRFGPIPIIGDLLGARSRDTRRQEIIFFLRPTILTNTEADNVELMKHVNEMPQRDEIQKLLDPKYVAPKSTLLDRILP